MCLAPGGTPARARTILILKQPPSDLNYHNHNALLTALKQEIADGTYADPAIWHPVIAELLTYASVHIAEIQTVIRRFRPYKYPACDVIEGIGKLFGLPMHTAFSRPAQDASLTEPQPGSAYEWDHGDLAILTIWVLHFASHLPLAVAALQHHPHGKTACHRLQRQILFRHQKQTVTMRNEDLQQRIAEWHCGRKVRITGLSLATLKKLLNQGYTLSQCRNVIHNGFTEDAPRIAWYHSEANWREELKDLPLTDSRRRDLEKLRARYQSAGKRAKAMARHIIGLLNTPEIALPLLRHVWPETAIEVDNKRLNFTRLDGWYTQGKNLQREMKSFSSHHRDAEVDDLLQRANTFIKDTGNLNFMSPLPLAA